MGKISVCSECRRAGCDGRGWVTEYGLLICTSQVDFSAVAARYWYTMGHGNQWWIEVAPHDSDKAEGFLRAEAARQELELRVARALAEQLEERGVRQDRAALRRVREMETNPERLRVAERGAFGGGELNLDQIAAARIMRINLPLRPLGRPWLFDDLQTHLCRVGAELGHECIPSADPVDADAWVVLRTVEAGSTPDAARTVGMIHDLYADDYGPGGARRAVKHCGGLVLAHPSIADILVENRIIIPKGQAEPATDSRRHLCRPIGACREFFEVVPKWSPLRGRGPFTLGWVGRPISYRGRDIKRLDRLVEAAELLGPPLRVLLIGPNLSATAELLRQAGVDVELHDRYPGRGPWETWAPALYARMDALLITSELEAGPMCLFEALAAGVPVVSTPCGWAKHYAAAYDRGVDFNGAFICDDAASVLNALRVLRSDPMPGHRAEIPALDSWCREVIELAVEVAR